jgi:hypothetical protein
MKDLLPSEKIVRKLKKTALLLTGEEEPIASASGETEPRPARTSTYIRKKLIQECQAEVQKVQENVLNNIEAAADLDLGQSIQNTREDIGVQCELGSEVYYKYSNLFEDESGDESVHSAQLSKVHSTCSDVEKDALKSPARKQRRRASVITHQQ